MSSPLDTEGWKLASTVQWVAKKKPIGSVCSYCNGNGEVGGGFKDMDGPRQCPECFGSGRKTVYPDLGEHPEIPPELIAALRKAWLEYFAQTPKVV